MRIAAILLCTFVSGCITDPVSRVQWDLSRDFMGRHPLAGKVAEWEPLKEIDGVTYGDCSNFAVSAQMELQKIGVNSRIAIAEIVSNQWNGGTDLHAFVLTEDGRVLDNHLALPSKIEYYRNRLIDGKFNYLLQKDLNR